MQALNILFVTEDFYPGFIGGQGIYGYHLVKNLAKKGHQVTVLAEKRRGRREFWKGTKNIRLIEVPFCFGNKLFLAVWEYLFFLRFCSNEYFDIVHLNGLSGLLFVLFKPKNVGKVIVMDHNTNYEMRLMTRSKLKKPIYSLLISLERRLFERADGILFNNPQEERSVKNYYKIDRIPTKAVYLGVESAKFSLKEREQTRLKVRNELGIPSGAKIVLYVGRLVERKRVDAIVKALNYARKAWPYEANVYGVVVGEGPERQRLGRMAGENVKFMGWDADPGKYYLASDCFVTVSVAEGGFLITALEAASYGLPLILSPSAAGFPIINEGINGFIADPDDPKDLADKIKRISKEMGEESRKLARQFSWERCVRQTVKFYRHVIDITG